MKLKKTKISYKGHRFNVNLKICRGFRKVFGLMLVPKQKAKALLFEFKGPMRKSIHSFLVFFSFIAIWLDEKNKVVDFKVVKPFRFFILPSRSFSKIIEIPLNKEYAHIMEILVGHRKI